MEYGMYNNATFGGLGFDGRLSIIRPREKRGGRGKRHISSNNVILRAHGMYNNVIVWGYTTRALIEKER